MLKEYNAHTHKSFVRKPVQEIPITTKIIDAIMPYFPKNCIVIAGYLSSDDQYWKVNFHWEYLRDMLDTALTKDLSDQHVKCVKAIRAAMDKNRPSPAKGYKSSHTVGKPVDKSSYEKIHARWKTVRQSKRDFKTVIDKAGLLAKTPPSRQAWHLSVAPVAAPGRSKHGEGYAIDISGSNSTIKKIAKALGATMAYDEKSHVHVEFKRGVVLPGKTAKAKPVKEGKTDASKYYTDNMCLSPMEVSKLKTQSTAGSFTPKQMSPALRGGGLSRLLK